MNSIEQQQVIQGLKDRFKREKRIEGRQNKALQDIRKAEDEIYAKVNEMVRMSGLCENGHSIEEATRLATDLILYTAEVIIRRMEGSIIA